MHVLLRVLSQLRVVTPYVPYMYLSKVWYIVVLRSKDVCSTANLNQYAGLALGFDSTIAALV